jgi:hypothetical protein
MPLPLHIAGSQCSQYFEIRLLLDEFGNDLLTHDIG